MTSATVIVAPPAAYVTEASSAFASSSADGLDSAVSANVSHCATCTRGETSRRMERNTTLQTHVAGQIQHEVGTHHASRTLASCSAPWPRPRLTFMSFTKARAIVLTCSKVPEGPVYLAACCMCHPHHTYDRGRTRHAANLGRTSSAATTVLKAVAFGASCCSTLAKQSKPRDARSAPTRSSMVAVEVTWWNYRL